MWTGRETKQAESWKAAVVTARKSAVSTHTKSARPGTISFEERRKLSIEERQELIVRRCKESSPALSMDEKDLDSTLFLSSSRYASSVSSLSFSSSSPAPSPSFSSSFSSSSSSFSPVLAPPISVPRLPVQSPFSSPSKTSSSSAEPLSPSSSSKSTTSPSSSTSSRSPTSSDPFSTRSSTSSPTSQDPFPTRPVSLGSRPVDGQNSLGGQTSPALSPPSSSLVISPRSSSSSSSSAKVFQRPDHVESRALKDQQELVETDTRETQRQHLVENQEQHHQQREEQEKRTKPTIGAGTRTGIGMEMEIGGPGDLYIFSPASTFESQTIVLDSPDASPRFPSMTLLGPVDPLTSGYVSTDDVSLVPLSFPSSSSTAFSTSSSSSSSSSSVFSTRSDQSVFSTSSSSSSSVFSTSSSVFQFDQPETSSSSTAQQRARQEAEDFAKTISYSMRTRESEQDHHQQQQEGEEEEIPEGYHKYATEPVLVKISDGNGQAETSMLLSGYMAVSPAVLPFLPTPNDRLDNDFHITPISSSQSPPPDYSSSLSSSSSSSSSCYSTPVLSSPSSPYSSSEGMNERGLVQPLHLDPNSPDLSKNPEAMRDSSESYRSISQAYSKGSSSSSLFSSIPSSASPLPPSSLSTGSGSGSGSSFIPPSPNARRLAASGSTKTRRGGFGTDATADFFPTFQRPEGIAGPKPDHPLAKKEGHTDYRLVSREDSFSSRGKPLSQSASMAVSESDDVFSSAYLVSTVDPSLVSSSSSGSSSGCSSGSASSSGTKLKASLSDPTSVISSYLDSSPLLPLPPDPSISCYLPNDSSSSSFHPPPNESSSGQFSSSSKGSNGSNGSTLQELQESSRMFMMGADRMRKEEEEKEEEVKGRRMRSRAIDSKRPATVFGHVPVVMEDSPAPSSSSPSPSSLSSSSSSSPRPLRSSGETSVSQRREQEERRSSGEDEGSPTVPRSKGSSRPSASKRPKALDDDALPFSSSTLSSSSASTSPSPRFLRQLPGPFEKILGSLLHKPSAQPSTSAPTAATGTSRWVKAEMSAEEAPKFLSLSTAQYEELPLTYKHRYADSDEEAELAKVRKLRPNAQNTSELVESPTLASDSSNWTQRFQDHISNIRNFNLNTSLELRSRSNLELLHLVQDFLHCAKTYGRIIISERYLHPNEKTIKPRNMGGAAGGEKYIVNNILFKFAVASSDIFSSDYAAMKMAGNELKGLLCYFNCNIPQLNFPLMALVDYMGLRLVAMSLLPIDNETLVYGTNDGGLTVHNKNLELSLCMKRASKILNLQSHICGLKTVSGRRLKGWKELHSAADVEGHVGKDGKFYVLDFSRSMPPEQPDPKVKGSHLFRLLRPEFVKIYHKPLCPDAFSGFQLADPNFITYCNDVQEATNFLINEHIPRRVRDSVSWQIIEAHESGSLHRFRLTEAMHAKGVNMRHIGAVLRWVRDEERFQPVKVVMVVEAVARVVKNLLRQQLRRKMKKLKQPLEAPYRLLAIDLLNLVFGRSSHSNQFWEQVIAHKLRKQFYFPGHLLDPAILPLKPTLLSDVSPPSPDYFPLAVMFQRVIELTGLKFSSLACKTKLSSISRLRSLFDLRIPFDETDLEEVGERVKHMNIASQAMGLYYHYKGLETRLEGDPVGAMGLFELSIEKYEEALSSNPTNKELLLNCAICRTVLKELQISCGQHLDDVRFHTQDNQIQKTDQYYIRAVDADPSDPISLHSYAKFLWRCQRVERAEEYFLQTLEADPNYVWGLRDYGNFLSEMKQEDLAEQFFLLSVQKSKLRNELVTGSRFFS